MPSASDQRHDLCAIGPQHVKAMTRGEKLAILRELRVRPLRRPALVLVCASDILSATSRDLGAELYDITEQCLVAALECGQLDQAKTCLQRLQKTFGPASIRVRKLQGLCLEASGEWDGARKVYEGILKDAPHDQTAVRRQVAILKAGGHLQEAIDVLERRPVYDDGSGNALKYQEVHALDLAAFKELTALHLAAGSADKAMFYAEECVLVDPTDYNLHTRHGEIAHSLGHFSRAAAAFSYSLQLNTSSNNARAAYGLLAAATAGGSAKPKSASTDEVVPDFKELRTVAANTLRTMYAGAPTAHYLDLMLRQAA